MLSKEQILALAKEQGRADALDLRSRADGMDATAIIAEEDKVPEFVWGTDYSGWPANSPIGETVDGEFQVFTMITPVNTAHYPGITPSTERSLYSLCHTKDPEKAKAWVAPLGTSGMYMLDECCVDEGRVWRSRVNNNDKSPGAYPVNWTDLGTPGDIHEEV